MGLLDRETIVEALTRLNRHLAARFLVGGVDLRFLADLHGLRSADAVLRVVRDYFPAERLPVRLLLEEMFDDRL